jgi:hypothetical protein
MAIKRTKVTRPIFECELIHYLINFDFSHLKRCELFVESDSYLEMRWELGYPMPALLTKWRLELV